MQTENHNMQPPQKEGRPGVNIGMIIFFIIFIYIIISILLSLGKEKVSVVEVQHGQIMDNGYYTGIILREETAVKANTSGYINFYVSNGAKAAKDSPVYMMTTSVSADAAQQASSFSGFSSDDYAQMRKIISLYTSNYSDSKYSDLYTFKYDLQNQITESISSQNISKTDKASGSYQNVDTDVSGIVSYTYDGLEGLSRDQITDSMFNSNNVEKYQLTSNQWVAGGSVAYKLVTDSDWEIIIKVTPTQAKLLAEHKTVTLRFVKDDVTAKAGVELFSNGESIYAALSLSKYMVRYISERYIDIELIASSAEGLKIPTSALIEKDFYKIPVDFLVTDENTNEEGFYTYGYDEDGTMTAIFNKTAIYANDGTFCYVDMNDFALGDYIGKLNSDERYRIGATGKLTGVYNINQGYSIFRLVDILYQNDEYCIIDNNTSYGVSQYDRIILNAALVEEDQLIY